MARASIDPQVRGESRNAFHEQPVARTLAPLRVAYESTLLQMNRTGGGRATRELAATLHELDGVELVHLEQPLAARAWRAGRVPRGLERELAWLPFGLPRAARRLGVDLLHLPAPLSIPATRLPLAMTIHDTFPWEHPEWCARALSLQHRTRVAPALRRVGCVIVPSRYSMVRVVERLGVDPAAVRVVPHGVSRAFVAGSPVERLPSGLTGGRPYVLGQWSTVPRKNLAGLLDCYERLAAAGLPHDLVLFGDDGPLDRRLLARLATSRWCARIHRVGWVSEGQLAALYRAADVFVFPTLGEGFGFPVLEAMASGTPVVSTTAGSIPEVAGDAAVLVAPRDGDALAGAVERLLREPGERRTLALRGPRRAAAFSWRRAAELTRAAYGLAVERAA